LLLLATVPIAIASNFIRVLSLVLLAYYGGVDALQGGLHELTGFALFAVAVALFCLFDATLGMVLGRLRRSGVRA
jgi:exosortase/archaeosortase family protein